MSIFISNVKHLINKSPSYISLSLARCPLVGQFLGRTVPRSTLVFIASVPNSKALQVLSHSNSINRILWLWKLLFTEVKQITMEQMSERPGSGSRTLNRFGWCIAFHCFMRLQAGLFLSLILNLN